MFVASNIKPYRRPRKPVTGDRKRPGASKKARTGCATCKTRHVKCDEARPQCNRCIKFGVECDGYTTLSGKPIAFRRDVLSRDSSLVPHTCGVSLSSILRLHTGPCLETEQETRFYRLWCHEVAAQLRGPYKTSVWEHLIPQACEAEPYVLHAVVGVGALNQAVRNGFQKSGEERPYNSQNATYQYALKQYDKALKGMRTAIATGKHDVRTALIACLLVFLFESLQGHPYSAVSNAKCGLMLLQEWESCRSSSKATYSGARALENDILNAYAVIDTQVLFFMDTRTQDEHHAAVHRFADKISSMPSEIENLEEVLNYWLLIQSWNYHFKILIVDALSDPAVSGQGGHADGKAAVTDSKYEAVFSRHVPISASAYELREQMEGYREIIRRWAHASTTIFEGVDKCGSQEERVTVALLKIYSNLSHIQLGGAFLTKETEYDAFLPEHTTIVELSESIYSYVASPSSSPGGIYRFFTGIIYPLSATAFRCRDKSIRARAINLLRKGPYREGIWNAQEVGCLANWIREVEEEGMDENGFIPEASRVMMTLCDIAPDGRTALLGCTSANEDGLKFRKEVVQWKT